MTPLTQPTMANPRQLFALSSSDFVRNLFVVDLNTPPSTNTCMQYMHPTNFDNEAGSTYASFQTTTQPLYFHNDVGSSFDAYQGEEGAQQQEPPSEEEG